MDRTSETHVAYHVPVQVAAERLGISEAAVRQRVKRGTLEARHKTGRLFVVLSQDILDTEQERRQRTKVRSRTRPRTMVRTSDNSASNTKALSADVQGSGEAEKGLSKAFDDLAEAFARDMKRQVERLEGQVDGLQAELRRKDEQHAEEMKRKDVLLQGYQQQVEILTTRIADMAPRPQIEAPRKSLAQLAQEQQERQRQDADAKAQKAVMGGIVEVLGRLMRRVT